MSPSPSRSRVGARPLLALRQTHATGETDLSTLFRHHGPALQSRARVLVGNRDEAEDILQEVFLAMVASPGLHRGEASAFTLLYQMVTHKALDRCRARLRGQHWLERMQPGTSSDGTGGGIGGVEATRDLRRMARTEAPQALTAALLHFVEGHTQGEVALLLGVSRKTVVRMLGRLAERVRPTTTEPWG